LGFLCFGAGLSVRVLLFESDVESVVLLLSVSCCSGSQCGCVGGVEWLIGGCLLGVSMGLCLLGVLVVLLFLACGVGVGVLVVGGNLGLCRVLMM